MSRRGIHTIRISRKKQKFVRALPCGVVASVSAGPRESVGRNVVFSVHFRVRDVSGLADATVQKTKEVRHHEIRICQCKK
jgi:hypothetical protein